MTRAAVRHFISPDAADLSSWAPPPGTEVWAMLVQALVGPNDGPGEESLEITVCTPAWIAWRLEDGMPPLDGRGRLLVLRYDWPTIERTLRSRIEACAGADWDAVGSQLARLGRWEFED